MAYVAIEIVTEPLNARNGTFTLIHNATRKKSEPASE
ncbi:hypothetical protein HDF17_002505 [Granulicella arctica]|uniref:Uncharacterized protein n=1 Tax=Granulicella arctica TaxID=940613 RepID=A0A7Y9THS1_9BACT|nr:hypothetical protein [Granulicella arctica]